MIPRRDVLKLAAIGFAAPLASAVAQTTPSPPVSTPSAPVGTPAPVPAAPAPPDFTPNVVVDRARALAKKSFVAPPTDLPSPFDKLNYDQYVAIRQKPGTAIWSNDNVGFALEPLHRGFIFSAPMVIHLVESGHVRTLGYDPTRFDFGGLTLPAKMPDIGYSGFRVLQPTEGQGFHDVAIFQGASFFRAIARGQNFGVTARALSLRTADPKGEEFPLIREVWIERPTLAADALVIHALLDSESVTGAYRFTLRPGDVAIVDTECTLIPRTAIDALGLGTMAGMYLFGPESRHGGDDVREGVYEVGGLQILNDNGEWLWRPVSNRDTLQLSSFLNSNPRGFGLLQRERHFGQFQDDDQHWELRPSLWIEPLSDWGEGSVVLVEIPSDAEINDNIVCFWRPKKAIPANLEVAYTYRQSFCWIAPERPTVAIVTDTRDGHGATGKQKRFIVEFSSEVFADPAKTADIKPMVSTSVGTIQELRTFISSTDKTFRVHFELDPGSETLAELRLVLEQGGKPASETWLYRWTA